MGWKGVDATVRNIDDDSRPILRADDVLIEETEETAKFLGMHLDRETWDDQINHIM